MLRESEDDVNPSLVNGFHPNSGSRPEAVLLDNQNHLNELKTAEFEISEINADALQRIITLVDSYGFDV